jgi:hypothetical protein
MFVAATSFAAVAATVVSAKRSLAVPPDQYGPYLSYSEGSLARTRLEIGFQRTGFPVLIPPSPRVDLVQSGVPADQAQRVHVRVRRTASDALLVGYTTSRLVADRVYDLVVRSQRDDPVVVPSAFTALAPRLTIDATPRARGETVTATIEFGSGRPRFRVGSRSARVVTSYGGGKFEFEIPRDLPRGVSEATVTVATAGTRVSTAVPLPIVPKRGALSAVVDGTRLSFSGQSYFASDHVLGSYRPGPAQPQVYVSGARSRRSGVGTASEGLVLRIPLDLATATFPVTLTGADGVVVSWSNSAASDADGNDRYWLAGPHDYFRGTSDVTVTLESIEGARLFGTFAAHVVNVGTSPLYVNPYGREFDITDGRFEVDPSPVPNAAN